MSKFHGQKWIVIQFSSSRSLHACAHTYTQTSQLDQNTIGGLCKIAQVAEVVRILVSAHLQYSRVLVSSYAVSFYQRSWGAVMRILKKWVGIFPSVLNSVFNLCLLKIPNIVKAFELKYPFKGGGNEKHNDIWLLQSNKLKAL